jgi:DnaJ-class molecular chaperone
MAAGGNDAARAAIRSWIEQQRQEVDRQSYYQLLGVARDAPLAEIRDAYYRLVARLHPDLYGDLLDPETRERLVTVYSRIVEGYRTLIDAGRREGYDRGLAAGRLRWSVEDERSTRSGPEEEIRNPSAKRFFKLARAAIATGDARSAVFNLKLALSVEPDSEVLKAELARAEALGKPRGG